MADTLAHRPRRPPVHRTGSRITFFGDSCPLSGQRSRRSVGRSPRDRQRRRLAEDEARRHRCTLGQADARSPLPAAWSGRPAPRGEPGPSRCTRAARPRTRGGAWRWAGAGRSGRGRRTRRDHGWRRRARRPRGRRPRLGAPASSTSASRTDRRPPPPVRGAATPRRPPRPAHGSAATSSRTAGSSSTWRSRLRIIPSVVSIPPNMMTAALRHRLVRRDRAGRHDRAGPHHVGERGHRGGAGLGRRQPGGDARHRRHDRAVPLEQAARPPAGRARRARGSRPRSPRPAGRRGRRAARPARRAPATSRAASSTTNEP